MFANLPLKLCRLTALEICKPEFQSAFGNNNDAPLAFSSLSSQNFHQSFASLSEWSPTSNSSEDDVLSLYSPSEVDLSSQAHQLLSNLRLTSPSCRHSSDFGHIQELESLIDDTKELTHTVICKFRARLQIAIKEVQDLRGNAERTTVFKNVVAHAANGKLGVRGLSPILARKKHRDSEDSQATAVSRCHGDDLSQTLPYSPVGSLSRARTATQTFIKESSMTDLSSEKLLSTSNFLDIGVVNSVCTTYMPDLNRVDREVALYEARIATDNVESPVEDNSVTVDENLAHLVTGRKGEKKDVSLSGAAKLKAWFKRIIAPEDRPPKLRRPLTPEHQDDKTGEANVSIVPFAVQEASDSSCDPLFDASIDNTLQTSHLILSAAERDLDSIGQCVTAVSRPISFVIGALILRVRLSNLSVWQISPYQKLNVFCKELLKYVVTDIPDLPGLIGWTET